MPTLHESGWRQGSYLQHQFSLTSVCSNENGETVTDASDHGVWIVATQDCDLDAADEVAEEPLIELRPVYDDGDAARWLGLRSREFRPSRDSTRYLHAQSPRIMISPAALSSCLDSGDNVRENVLSVEDRVKFKTWLGKRYDRPAVPRTFRDLGGRIAQAVKQHRRDEVARSIRDVLWQVEPGDPPLYKLFAIVENEDDEEPVREWLTRVSWSVPGDLGVADGIEAKTAKRVSLHLIETSFSADVSDITWSKGLPRGAY